MPKSQTIKQLEKQIPKAVLATLGASAVSFERIPKGEVNKVYKVITTQGNVLIRIFKKKATSVEKILSG